MSREAVTVRRLRLAAELGGEPGRRRAVENWLAERDPARYGLPPGALLVVRQARLPWLAIASGADRDPLRASARGAARPARDGFVGAAAQAVWFADDAELLASLAGDLLADRLAPCWWWPLVLGARPDAASAVEHWRRTPRAVPSALQQLADHGRDRAWLDRIGATGCEAILTAVAAAYAVGSAAAALWRPIDAGGGVDGRTGSRADPGVATDSRFGFATGEPSSSQGRGIDESTAGFNGVAVNPDVSHAGQRLLALCGLLRVDPTQVLRPSASTNFGSEAETGAGSRQRDRGGRGQSTTAAGSAIAANIPASDFSSGRRSAKRTGPNGFHSDSQRAPAPNADATGGDRLRPTVEPARRRVGGGYPLDPSSAGRKAAAALSADASGQASERAAPSLGSLRAKPPARRADAFAVAETPQPAVFDTRFGGLAFVMNVALAFGWYGDFSRPLEAGLAVPPWQLLHAVGVAAAGRRFRCDPLSAWLRRRVASVAAPRATSWQAEPGWLAAFAADRRPWIRVADARGWRLLHPAGFVIARGDAGSDFAAVIRELDPPHGLRESAPKSPVPVRESDPDAADTNAGATAAATAAATPDSQRRLPPPTADDLPRTLARWVAARVGLALEIPARPALTLAVKLPARVVVAGERWDAYFQLAGLPLALRLAGLDRDPGWVPAAGCDLRFHFG